MKLAKKKNKGVRKLSRWVIQFEDHPVHQIISDVLDSTNEALEAVQNNPDVIEHCHRIKQVLNQANHVLADCDPIMVSIKTLDNLNNTINNINNEIKAFISNNNIGHLNNANNQIDSVLIFISDLFQNLIFNNLEGSKESISSFRKSVGQYLRHVEEEYKKTEAIKEELEQGFRELGSTVDIQKNRLDTAISEFQSQFSTAEENRKTQFFQEEEKRQINYNSATEERKEEFDQKISELQNSYESLVKDLELNNQKIERESNKKLQKYIEKLEEYKVYAENLINVIANTGMAGGYQKIADEERKAATFWRTISVGSLVGLIIFAVATFYLALSSQFEWTQFAARIFVAATFGGLFAYSSKQASDHKKLERINRKTELELATIDPYLVGLPEDKKYRIKELMAERLFGKDNKMDSKNEDLSDDATDLLKTAFDTVQMMIKKV